MTMTTAHTRATSSASAIPIQAPKPASSNVSGGILCMIIATVAFSITYALSKWLVASYPVGQVLFSRSFVGFATCAAFLLPMHGVSVLLPRYRRLTGCEVCRSPSRRRFRYSHSV